MNLLHHYIFIPLDIFKKTHQNGDVSTKLDAWLMFLSTDEPNKIMRLVDKFPEFLALYRHIYEICANTEDIMGIFSEALAEMDRNTVDYMIDEMQKKKDQLQSENDQLQSENDQLQSENDQLQSENDQLQQEKDQIQQQNDQLQIENELLKQKLYELQNQSTSNSQ